MKKATLRPSVQTRYAAQVQTDRRLAAAQRRLERATGIATELDTRKALYSNVGA